MDLERINQIIDNDANGRWRLYHKGPNGKVRTCAVGGLALAAGVPPSALTDWVDLNGSGVMSTIRRAYGIPVSVLPGHITRVNDAYPRLEARRKALKELFRLVELGTDPGVATLRCLSLYS